MALRLDYGVMLVMQEYCTREVCMWWSPLSLSFLITQFSSDINDECHFDRVGQFTPHAGAAS